MELHILDTETASLQGGVCEIAWLVVDEHLTIQSEFSTYVDPERPIEPGAMAVHGITDEMVKGKPTLAQVAGMLSGPIDIVGHNVAFDVRMVKPLIVAKTQLCTLALSRQFCKGVSKHKLDVLQAELPLPAQKSHSALGDVHTVRDLLLHITDTSGTPFNVLWARGQKARLLHEMPYGKYEGKPFHLVPKPYREWLLTQEGLAKDLEYTLRTMKEV